MLAALGILLLTAVLSLAWSHARLMWNDEFLSFYSDSVPTLAGVLHVQWHTPISLDPPTYHLLSHLAMDVIGRNAIALRLPALFGFLLLEASLFFLVRRLAGSRAGLIAMALPLCTASFRYSVEGRPYGLLLGLYAASLLCWYVAAQRGDAGKARTLPLLGLFVAIALAITSHYFGMLILLPVSAGEALRSLQLRRFLAEDEIPPAPNLRLPLSNAPRVEPAEKKRHEDEDVDESGEASVLQRFRDGSQSFACSRRRQVTFVFDAVLAVESIDMLGFGSAFAGIGN